MKIRTKNAVFSPGRLINLWEMNQLLTEDFLNAWISFRNEFLKAARNKAQPMSVLEVEDRKKLIRALEVMQQQWENLGFENSLKCCQELLTQLTDVSWHWDSARWEAITEGKQTPPMPKKIPPQTFQQVYAQMRLLYDFLREEMKAIKLVVIQQDKVRFFEQDALFGLMVKSAAGDELNAEIRAAGNCIAADLNTAAVFHLMRTVEHGARFLAARLDVGLSKKQINQSEWRTLIGAMEGRILLSQRRKNPIALKPGQLKLFRGCVQDIKAFKDLWRNDVMHTRGNYTSAEAQGVLDHTGEFIKRLASSGVPLK